MSHIHVTSMTPHFVKHFKSILWQFILCLAISFNICNVASFVVVESKSTPTVHDSSIVCHRYAVLTSSRSCFWSLGHDEYVNFWEAPTSPSKWKKEQVELHLSTDLTFRHLLGRVCSVRRLDCCDLHCEEVLLRWKDRTSGYSNKSLYLKVQHMDLNNWLSNSNQTTHCNVWFHPSIVLFNFVVIAYDLFNRTQLFTCSFHVRW